MKGSTKVGATFGIGALICSFLFSCTAEIQVTPDSAKYGWSPAEVKTPEHIAEVASLPPFELTDDEGNPVRQENEKANVRLWKYSKILRGGEHFPNVPQEVGDCTAWGGSNAVNYLLATQIARDAAPQEFHFSYPPYLYGYSRVKIGKNRINGDGSTGLWTAKAAKEGGILRADAPDVPKYSGDVSRTWGRKGPPEEFITFAKQYPVQTFTQVRTAEEVRDAVCNGYPCTIASDAGFLMHPPTIDGRLVNKRSGTWNHQMCIIGYDGETGSEPYWYVINSWGASAHGTPPDDAPPGGFWIRKRDVDYIVKQNDSYAYSSFAGFPSQPLDFKVFGSQREKGLRKRKPDPKKPLNFDNLFPKKTSAVSLGSKSTLAC